MPNAAELRAVSDTYFHGYMWPLAAWTIGVVVLFVAGWVPFALWLCYPLAAWYGVLTAVWWIRMQGRRASDDLTPDDGFAGARNIGRFLAAASLIPALVFLAIDPLSRTTLSTCAGVAAVAGIAWLVANFLPKLRRRPATVAALLVAWLALPLNATGAVTLAGALGLIRPLWT